MMGEIIHSYFTNSSLWVLGQSLMTMKPKSYEADINKALYQPIHMCCDE